MSVQVSVLNTGSPTAGNGANLPSADVADTPYGKLPRMADAIPVAFSQWRDTQFREVLGAALDAILGHGVIQGGMVEATGDLAAKMPLGTVFFAGGGIWRTTQDASWPSLDPVGPNYLWANPWRQPADLSAGPLSIQGQMQMDTFGVDLDQNTDGVPPWSMGICVAVIAMANSKISSIDNFPVGKFIGSAASGFPTQETIIPAGATRVIPAGAASIVGDDLQINGDLYVGGSLRIL